MIDKTFAVLFGPSAVGKSLVIKALREFCHLDFCEPPVIKAKECRPDCKPRPEDIPFWDNPDYFRLGKEIEEFKDRKNPRYDPRYIVAKCRKHWQAFDLENVVKSEKPLIFRDLYYTFRMSLGFSEYLTGKAELKTIFLSPFEKFDMGSSSDEFAFLEHVHCLMAQRLALRSFKQNGDQAYSQAVVQDNETRAITAFHEIMGLCSLDDFVYNPFPEGHPAWNYDDKAGLFHKEPSQEAMAVVRQVERILTGQEFKGY